MGETRYFNSWEEVVNAFEKLVFKHDDVNTLNAQLEKLNIRLYEYDTE